MTQTVADPAAFPVVQFPPDRSFAILDTEWRRDHRPLLADAMGQCWRLGIPQLWVTPRTYPSRPSRRLALMYADATGWDIQGVDDLPVDPRRPEPGWHHSFRESADFDRYTLGVAFPAGMARDSYLADLTAVELAECLTRLRELLEVPFRRTPETTASDLMYALHRRSGGLQLFPTPMPPPALDPTVERDLYWVRDLTATERRRSVVTAWDVNAAYLGACSSLRLGVGAARRVVVDGLFRGDGRDCLPGYYHALIRYTPPPGLPNPFPTGRAWVTTPTMQLAGDLHAHVNVSESWVWDAYARPLEPFYKTLRTAREALILGPSSRASQAALMALKRMWGPFLGGRVAATRDGWDRTSDPLYRPDWRHFVIATTRARVFRALLRLEDARPFAVHTDALYFAVDDDLAPAGLRVGRNPGTFKAAGVVPLSTAGNGQRPDLDAIEDAMRAREI